MTNRKTHKSIKKIPGGWVPLSGIKYKFMKVNKVTKLWIVMGVDIQKLLKIKAGNRLELKYDKKNPYKILISKTKSKERNTYSILQYGDSKNVHIVPTWKFKKPPALAFKKTRKAKLNVRKAGISIELKFSDK